MIDVPCSITDVDPPCPDKNFFCLRTANGGNGVCCGKRVTCILDYDHFATLVCIVHYILLSQLNLYSNWHTL